MVEIRRTNVSRAVGTGRSPRSRAATLPARELQGLGRQLGETGDEIDTLIQAQERTDADLKLAAFRESTNEINREREENAPRGASGFANATLDDFDTRSRELMGNVAGRQQQYVQGQLANYRARVHDQALTFETNSRTLQVTGDIDDMTRINANLIVEQPDAIEELTTQTIDTIRNSGLRADVQEAMITKARGDYFASYSRRLSQSDPQRILSELEEGRWAEFAEGRDAVIARNSAVREIDRRRREAEAAFKAQQRTAEIQAEVNADNYKAALVSGRDPGGYSSRIYLGQGDITDPRRQQKYSELRQLEEMRLYLNELGPRSAMDKVLLLELAFPVEGEDAAATKSALDAMRANFSRLQSREQAFEQARQDVKDAQFDQHQLVVDNYAAMLDQGIVAEPPLNPADITTNMTTPEGEALAREYVALLKRAEVQAAADELPLQAVDVEAFVENNLPILMDDAQYTARQRTLAVQAITESIKRYEDDPVREELMAAQETLAVRYRTTYSMDNGPAKTASIDKLAHELRANHVDKTGRRTGWRLHTQTDLQNLANTINEAPAGQRPVVMQQALAPYGKWTDKLLNDLVTDTDFDRNLAYSGELMGLGKMNEARLLGESTTRPENFYSDNLKVQGRRPSDYDLAVDLEAEKFKLSLASSSLQGEMHTRTAAAKQLAKELGIERGIDPAEAATLAVGALYDYEVIRSGSLLVPSQIDAGLADRNVTSDIENLKISDIDWQRLSLLKSDGAFLTDRQTQDAYLNSVKAYGRAVNDADGYTIYDNDYGQPIPLVMGHSSDTILRRSWDDLEVVTTLEIMEQRRRRAIEAERDLPAGEGSRMGLRLEQSQRTRPEIPE